MSSIQPSIKNGTRIERAVTIRREKEVLFSFWRRFSNLSVLLPDLISVAEVSLTESRWVFKGPAETTFEWNAVIINEEPGELIAWITKPSPTHVHTSLVHAGTVRFQDAPVGRGTEVHVVVEYELPGGILGKAAAALSGDDPSKLLAEFLYRFKALMETDVIPSISGQPIGSGKETVQ